MSNPDRKFRDQWAENDNIHEKKEWDEIQVDTENQEDVDYRPYY